MFVFSRCVFHGHDCRLTARLTHHPYKKDKPLQECLEDTENISKYLREDVGVNVVEMWECEWASKKRENPCIQAFLDDNTIGFRSALRGSVNQMSILEKVKDGSLFGLVQCDLHVPDNLRDYFSEMPPVFKIQLYLEMKYCIANNLLKSFILISISGSHCRLATNIVETLHAGMFSSASC